MTSPIELLRDGIQSGDWSLVCDGFASLTGQRVSPPSGDRVVVPGGLPRLYYEQVGRHLLHYLTVLPTDGRVAGHPEPLAPPPDALGEDEPFPDDEDDDEDEEIEVPRTPARPLPVVRRAEPPAPPAEPKVRTSEPVAGEPPARAEDPFAKFRVQHGTPKRSDGKQACRAEPYTPPTGENKFSDTLRLAAKEVADSRKFSETKEPEPRRDPVKKVRVQCAKCDRVEEVPPILAGGNVDPKGNDVSSHVCDACIRETRHQ